MDPQIRYETSLPLTSPQVVSGSSALVVRQIPLEEGRIEMTRLRRTKSNRQACHAGRIVARHHM
jgi:hypothetical protein